MSFKEVMIIVITLFVFTSLITPFVRKIAFHIGAVDIPNTRKVHKTPMPRLGGLAIFLGFLLGYMLFAKQTTEMIAILIGGFIIILTGIVDDINQLDWKIKLIGQILAALVIPLYGGIVLNHVSAFGIVLEFGLLTYPITVFFIIALINCINIIDGLDGLASGISSIYFLTIGIIAFITNMINGLDVVLAFIMLGSTLGFLYHNFYPAKIFMGDSGSMFLGYIIAVIALLGFKNVTLTSLIIPMLILAIPILDTALAIIRRALKKQSFSVPDRAHFHHQILDMKLGHRNTVLIIYLINCLFAFASIIYVLKDAKTGIIIYVALTISTVWFIMTTNIITDKPKTPKKLTKILSLKKGK